MVVELSHPGTAIIQGNAHATAFQQDHPDVAALIIWVVTAMALAVTTMVVVYW